MIHDNNFELGVCLDDVVNYTLFMDADIQYMSEMCDFPTYSQECRHLCLAIFKGKLRDFSRTLFLDCQAAATLTYVPEETHT